MRTSGSRRSTQCQVAVVGPARERPKGLRAGSMRRRHRLARCHDGGSRRRARSLSRSGQWMISIPQPPPMMVDAVVERMKKDGVKKVGYIGFSDSWGDLVYDALIKTAGPAHLDVLTNERVCPFRHVGHRTSPQDRRRTTGRRAHRRLGNARRPALSRFGRPRLQRRVVRNPRFDQSGFRARRRRSRRRPHRAGGTGDRRRAAARWQPHEKSFDDVPRRLSGRPTARRRPTRSRLIRSTPGSSSSTPPSAPCRRRNLERRNSAKRSGTHCSAPKMSSARMPSTTSTPAASSASMSARKSWISAAKGTMEAAAIAQRRPC